MHGSRRYDVSDDVVNHKRNTGLISIEHVQKIVYAKSNGHMTDDVTRPYDVIVVTMQQALLLYVTGTPTSPISLSSI